MPMRCWLLAVCALCFTTISGDASKKPEGADLTLKNAAGERVSLRDFRGQIVVLNFWATWCGPCREEMPLLVDAWKRYKDRGVVFLGASLDDAKTRKDVPDFAARFHAEFAILLGASSSDLARLHMGDAVPATAFLDRDGAIVARVSGEIRKAELDERIDWLLSDRSGPAPKPMVTHLDP